MSAHTQDEALTDRALKYVAVQGRDIQGYSSTQMAVAYRAGFADGSKTLATMTIDANTLRAANEGLRDNYLGELRRGKELREALEQIARKDWHIGLTLVELQAIARAALKTAP